MFTDNQAEILDILSKEPNSEFSMSDLGRLLDKAPGVFQRGLNSLETHGYIQSRREGNRRLFRLKKNVAEYIIAAPENEAGPGVPPGFINTYPILPLPMGERAGVRGNNSIPLSSGGSMVLREPPKAYETAQKKILIIAGPNGAGKTTFAREYLVNEAACPVFINADYLAHGLSPLRPEQAALRAGKLMLKEMADHIRREQSVAVETTLSGHRYANMIPEWRKQGYAVKMIFLSLSSVKLALARVAIRVRQGGHNIPEQTIRRRYMSGKINFDKVYKHIVDAWVLFDNSGEVPVLIDEWEREI